MIQVNMNYGQCFNGALDKDEMRYALDILNVSMSEKYYNLMLGNADNAGVKGLEDDYSSNHIANITHGNASDTESDADSISDEDDGMVCDFTHFKTGLLTAKPFDAGDEELSDLTGDYCEQNPTNYIKSSLRLCCHILIQTFNLMDQQTIWRYTNIERCL